MIKLEDVEFTLVAFGYDLFNAFEKEFSYYEKITVLCGDILGFSGDAIVSPANSFGYMDGGLDLKYSQFFGWDLEKRVRSHIEKEFNGEIPIGCATITSIDNSTFSYLISAPTMRVPMDVSNTVNAYWAFKGILESVERFNQIEKNSVPIKSVFCPGLGTGEGKLPSELCAKQMRYAYDACVFKKFVTKGGLAGAVRNHLDLIGKPLE